MAFHHDLGWRLFDHDLAEAWQAAFDACNFVMDYLKARAPFWKKEDTAEGPRWVEGRCSDQAAAQRWEE